MILTNVWSEYLPKYHHFSIGRVSRAEAISEIFLESRGNPKYGPTSKISFRTIRQVDPNFTQDNFVRFLEKEMIPIVLEAAAMNDQEVVEDWALDAPSQKLLLSHNAAKKGNTNNKKSFEKLFFRKIEIFWKNFGFDTRWTWPSKKSGRWYTSYSSIIWNK